MDFQLKNSCPKIFLIDTTLLFVGQNTNGHLELHLALTWDKRTAATGIIRKKLLP